MFAKSYTGDLIKKCHGLCGTYWWCGECIGKKATKFRNPDRRIILEWILKKSFGKAWIEFIWLRIEISDKTAVNTVVNLRFVSPCIIVQFK